MEKRKKDLLSIRSYLILKIRENSAPPSLCAPFVLSRTKVHCVIKDLASTPSIQLQKSNCLELFTQPFIRLWLAVSSKLWTVAKCSTSHNYEGTGQNTYAVETLHGDDDREWDSDLPGMQRRRHTNGKTPKKLAVTDMQVNQQIELETGLDRLREMYALG